MNSEKRSFGIAFLLFLLMLCKVSAFHVFTHQNESPNAIESCSICDVALESQHLEINVPAKYHVPTISFFLFDPLTDFNFSALRFDEFSLGKCYCRPPPSLV